MRDSLLAEPGKFCVDVFRRSRAGFIAAMRERGILVRDRSRDPGCAGCVRITLGSAKDNERFLNACAEARADGHAREGDKVRKARIERKTKETDIRLALTVDGKGRYKVSTGIRFFDHMLELFAHHGGFDLELKATGDLDVDQHHTVEDVGIVLGQGFARGAGEQARHSAGGIFRDADGRDVRAGGGGLLRSHCSGD